MGVKRRLFLFTLAFIGILLLFLAYSPQHTGVMAQKYEPESEADRINSSPDNNIEITPSEVSGNSAMGEVVAVENLEVTVYEQGLALVKEKREINLERGVNQVEYSDVASGIDPASVIIKDLENKDIVILEQNYEYNLANSSSLLEKYLGKEITVTGKNGEIYNGTLLSYEGNSIVLKTETGSIVIVREISKIELEDSTGLSARPALMWHISSPVAGTRELLISYLTSGIGWKANYVLISNENDTEADIRGWVNIDNRAGLTYENASLKLVSGEINRVSPPVQPLPERAGEAVSDETKSTTSFAEEALSEYHLYTLERPTTLRNNQEKQISLFSVDSVPVEKELVYDSALGERVKILLTFENSNRTGLGRPLPAGTVRVYKNDYAGELQFLGEDRIKHTPENEKLKMTVGSAFDLTVTRNQTDYQRVSDNVERVSYEIEINNSKSETQNVTVVEHLFGEWKILESSDPYKKTDAFTIEFKVAVPANSTKVITYTVERRF